MTLKGQIRRRNSIVVNLETSEMGILIENASPKNHVDHAEESVLSTDPVWDSI